MKLIYIASRSSEASNLSFSAKSKIRIISTCLGVFTAGMIQASTDFSKGLIYYHPFDGEERPSYTQGSSNSRMTGASFTTGVVNEGIKIQGREGRYETSASMNLERPAGTLAFWVKPGWTLPSPDDDAFSFFSDENFRVSYLPKQRILTFMTGKTMPEEGFRWDYSTSTAEIRNWSPNEWYHIAVTWDAQSGKKEMYIDGALATQSRTEYIRDDSNRQAGTRYSHFRLSGPAGDTTYDEFAIWNRVLSAREIRDLHRRPKETAKAITDAIASVDMESSQTVAPLQWTIVPAADPSDLVITPSETIEAQIPVKNTSTLPFHGEVELRLYNFREELVEKTVQSLSLQPGEATTLKQAYAPELNGTYKIGISYKSSDKQFERDIFAFAVWPEPTPNEHSFDSFFGSHVNSFTETRVAFAARLGERWQRNHNMLTTTWWPRVEPEPGVWDPFDQHMLENHVKHDIHVLGQLFGTPYWAIESGEKRPPQPEGTPYPASYPYGNPPKLDAFANYVDNVVTQYKDTIRYWEIWNEPDVSLFWRGTPAQFAEVVRVGYEAVKKADPTAIVMMAGFTSSAWRWHEETAKAGAFKYTDVISFHYGTQLSPPEENDARLKQIINHFQNLAIKYGPGHELPMWSTEGGIMNTSWLRGLDYDFLPSEDVRDPLMWRKPMIRIVQGSVIMQRNGIEKHFFYFQNPIRPVVPSVYKGISLFEVNHSPRPAWLSRLTLANQVDGLDYIELVERPEVRLWANIYGKEDSQEGVVVLWVGDGGKVILDEGEAPPIFNEGFDIMGNPLSKDEFLHIADEPSYLRFNNGIASVRDFFEKASITIIEKPEALERAESSDAPQMPELPHFVAVEEVPGRDFIVDLTDIANMGLADEVPGDNTGGWLDQGSLNDGRDIPVGPQNHYSVPLEIIDPKDNDGLSIIVLKGSALTPGFPKSSGEILIGDGNERIRALYFLHTAGWVVRPQVIGHYVVRYASNKTLEIPIETKVNTSDWWQAYEETEDARPVPFLATQTPTGEPAWRYLRLWEWQNPHPEDPIVSVEMVSTGTDTTPILLSITALKVP